MNNIIHKEIKLVIPPAVFIFPLLTALLLIPNYPTYIAMLYSIISLQIIFQVAESNKDLVFTAMLPVSRNNVVLSRHVCVMIIQLLQIVVAIPFAIVSCLVTNKTGNTVSLDANIAFFALSLVSYAVFNIVFLPNFYKTGYKLAKPILLGIIAFVLLTLFFEVIIATVPFLKNNLDSLNPNTLVFQLPLLVVGIAVYAGLMYLSYKKSILNFAKVSL